MIESLIGIKIDFSSENFYYIFPKDSIDYIDEKI